MSGAIPASHGARDVLSRLLHKTYGGDAVAFMHECFEMVLDEQPGLWVRSLTIKSTNTFSPSGHAVK